MVMPRTKNDQRDEPRQPRSRIAWSLRQFGVGELLAVTALFAVLFGGLTALDAHPLFLVVAALFFAAVWIGQMLLFGGKNPRKASVLTGCVMTMFMSPVLVLWFADSGSRGGWLGILLWVVLSPALGAMFGYAAGALICGALMDARWIGRLSKNHCQDDPGEAFSPDFSGGERDGDRSEPDEGTHPADESRPT